MVHPDKRFSEAFSIFAISAVHSPPFMQNDRVNKYKNKEVNNLKLKIRSEHAVSPVIGVILMVAITVILAAIIAAFVFSTAGNINQNYLIAATSNQVSGDRIDTTYMGGTDHVSLEWMNFSVDGAMEHQELNPAVGYTWSSSNGTSERDHVIVTGHFVDGAEQVILDTYV